VEVVEKQFAPRADAPQHARMFLREALTTWELDGFGEVTELLTSELVSNVVRHVGRPLTLRIKSSNWVVRVEVDDPSCDRPVLLHVPPGAEHGRGILLVDALSDRWGTEIHDDDGKTVWFEVDARTAGQAVHL
jgi:anti-sigma regulatory factor (Ser/Thr protein kinase)